VRARFTIYLNSSTFVNHNSGLDDVLGEARRAAASWNGLDADIELVLAQVEVEDEESYVYDLGSSADSSTLYCGASNGVSSISMASSGDLDFVPPGAGGLASFTKCDASEPCLISEVDISIVPWTSDMDDEGNLIVWDLDWRDEAVSPKVVVTHYDPFGYSTGVFTLPIVNTLQHELGHALGIDDMYEDAAYKDVSLMGMKASNSGGTVASDLRAIPLVDCRAVWNVYGPNPESDSSYPPAACAEADTQDWECLYKL
jgi:hypothetical protein